ncbi:MAG TPA: Mth938-like domain-containing protein [Gammaproteobacteria bacterium]|jgi:uncharacterized protein|nr:Mth938-like domain-containing protein [Gammaproteobacteria bacterium]
MSTLQLDENPANFQIRAFKPGMIQINDKTLTQSVIVAPNQLIEDWPPQAAADLSAAVLAPILELKPDVVLIGTGSTHVLLPIEVYGFLINHQIGVEVMATAAACRTYNALSAEGRNVVAALLLG